AGHHLGQHDSEGPDIGTLIHKLADRLLRRHVADRARSTDALRAARRGQTRQPEIDDLHYASLRENYVGRLDIAMDQRARMCGSETLRRLEGDVHHFYQGKWTAAQ